MQAIALAGKQSHLSRAFRECGKFGDIRCIVLNDEGGVQGLGDTGQAFHRGQCLGAVVVEGRHAAVCKLLFEMHHIAGKQHCSGFWQTHEKACFTRRMSGRRKNGDSTIAEDIAITGDRIHLGATVKPWLDKGRIDRKG